MDYEGPKEIYGAVTPLSSTALGPYRDAWRRTTLDLARRGAITPASVYPYGRSLHYLIAHLAPDHDSLIPLDLLYAHFRNHAPYPQNASLIGRPQFEGHLERWAAVVDLDIDDHMLIGAAYRTIPLGADAQAAFIDGMLATARA